MAATTEVDTLPLSVIAAIAKSGIGEGMNISKEAKVALQRAAGVFILYLNSAANDVCKSSKRSTVSGPDILRALEEIDMGELVKPCKETLEALKSADARKKASRPPPAKRAKVVTASADGEGEKAAAAAGDADEAAAAATEEQDGEAAAGPEGEEENDGDGEAEAAPEGEEQAEEEERASEMAVDREAS